MAMSFEYRTLRTLDEGLAALAEGGDTVHVLAGGMSLVPRMKRGSVVPSVVLDLKRVPGLGAIAVSAGGQELEFGALVRHREIETSPLVRERLPVFTRLIESIASVQVRNFATLGGNLCAAEPFSDPPYLLVALDAFVELHGTSGSRRVAVAEFITGPGRTSKAHGELVTRVTIPLLRPREGVAYARVAGREALAPPLIAAAAKVTLSPDGTIGESRLVLGAAGGTPQRMARAEAAVRGCRPTNSFDAIAADVSAAADILDDDRCTAAYKRQVAGILLRRALRQASRDAAGASAA
jgi:carbon-monoxide dehydrogenase medium subunit